MNQQRKQYTGSGPFLRSQAGILPLSLPVAWQLQAFADFPKTTIQSDVQTTAIGALQTPNTLPLSQQLKLHCTVCSLIEDLTRTLPKEKIFKAVLDTLQKIGTPNGDIDAVIALCNEQYSQPSVSILASGGVLLSVLQ